MRRISLQEWSVYTVHRIQEVYTALSSKTQREDLMLCSAKGRVQFRDEAFGIYIVSIVYWDPVYRSCATTAAVAAAAAAVADAIIVSRL